MEDLLPIIQKLLDENFFAPTKSRMAKDLGRKDKNIFYGRLSATSKDEKPALGAAALEALYSNICYSYNISEYTLWHLVDIWDMACALAEVCEDEDFLPLVRKKFSVVQDSTLRAQIRTLSKESALDYCYMLAIFYCKILQLDPNQKKNTHVLIEVAQNVQRVLGKYYPENIAAHKIANDTIDQARSVQLLGWCNLMILVGRVICCYSNPYYLEETIPSDFVSLPIGEESWWISQDEQNSDKAKLYYLLTDEDQPIYDVLEVDADLNEAINSGMCSFYRWAFLRDYDVLRTVQPHGNKLLQWGYFDYQYIDNESLQKILVSPNKELNGKHVPPFLPKIFVRVPEDSSWGKWISSQEEDAALEILANKEIESMGLEDTDYEVVDVILSRKCCRLQYKLPKQSSMLVEFSVDSYPSLKHISIWDDVYILRGPIDQSLYAYWPIKNLIVKIESDISKK